MGKSQPTKSQPSRQENDAGSGGSSDSEMLTNSEIERLRRSAKETSDYARKAFRDRPPVDSAMLAREEIDELRRSATRTSDYARKAFKNDLPA